MVKPEKSSLQSGHSQALHQWQEGVPKACLPRPTNQEEAKTAVSEKAIAEIRAGALDSVSLVATETATAVVAAIGGSADVEAISAAVAEQMKG